MKKKFLCILLALCLLAALAPMSAMAATGSVTVKIGFDNEERVLTRQKGESEIFLTTNMLSSTYSVWLDYSGNKPLLKLKGLMLGTVDAPLKGAAITVTGDCPDIVIEADSAIYSAGTAISLPGSAKITSENNAKLTIATKNDEAHGIYTTGAGEMLTLNANLDIKVEGEESSAIHAGDANLTIAGGNIKAYAGWGRVIRSEGSITVTGGNIDSTSYSPNYHAMRAQKAVTISGGTLKLVNSNPDESGETSALQANDEDLTITGGSVYVNSDGYAVCVRGGNFVIKGGTVELVSMKGVCFKDSIDITGYTSCTAIVGESADDYRFYDAESNKMTKIKYLKVGPYDASITEPTEPPAPTTEPTAPPTQPTETPTQPTQPATKPTTPATSDSKPTAPAAAATDAPTQPADGKTEDGGSNVTVYIIAAVILLAGIGGTVAVVMIRKKKQ